MKVILPGSYDPITLGHLEIIKRAAEKFDEVFVTVFINPEKEYMFSTGDRVKMLELATEDIKNVTVGSSDGYVVDYMRERGIDKIVKGYRNDVDLEYEMRQAEFNLSRGGYETELWKCREGLEGVSSTAAREAIAVGAPLDMLPDAVAEYILRYKKA